MDLLFFAYSNSESSPLPTLQEEYDEVYKTLSRRATQRHFMVHRDATTNIKKVAEYLLLSKDFITVFCFSGHAEEHALFLDDEEAHSDGIAEILSKCPKLKVVILNGCSTGGQVSRLLELGVPVVIATSAPVNDRSAAQFATSFFQMMAEQKASIKEAFEAGVAAAKIQRSDIDAITSRGGLDLDGNSEQPLWGLFINQNGEIAQNWKLPSTPVADYTDHYKPNEYLIESLLSSLAPFNEAVNKLQEQEDMGIDQSILDKREAILKCLPYPISEQFRKLLCPMSDNPNELFFDKPSFGRLRQLARTYNTIVELMAFVMLAQLWDALTEDKDNAMQVPEEHKQDLKDFFNLQQDGRESFDFYPVIIAIRKIFDHNEINYFVKELETIKKDFNDKSEFYYACQFMESVKKQLARKEVEDAEVTQLCKWVEEKLGTILSHIGFIANYTLASVKDINFLNYRHFHLPKYKHNLVRLVQRFVGLEEEQQVLEDFMDNSSVILMRADKTRPGFLNLSPFVIDQNAFDNRAPLAKLYFYERYVKGMDSFCFKHIYKPDDEPLVVKKERPYTMVKAQFEAFSQLVFNQSMKTI